LQLYDGEFIRAVATRGLPDAFADMLRQPRRRGSRLALRHAPFVQIADIADPVLTGGDKALAAAHDIAGVRTVLSVPLLKDDALLGVIVAGRREVRPFTEKQIALLQNFAAQAVIAMENARLITETREALEQQTATAEVLQVINSSPGDLAPVFDAMLEKAMRLCGIDHGTLQSYDGETFRAVAVRGLPEPLAARLRDGFRLDPDHSHPMAGLLRGDRYVSIPDLRQVEEARFAVEHGSRTLLCIPLRKDGTLLGQIVAVRQEVRPFGDKEIALLENFAAQAVIAMENARLLTETREALEQQTATAEVLGVINSSPGDLAPVFDAMLEKALQLCGASFGSLQTYHGDYFETVAAKGFPSSVEWRSIGPLPMSRGITQQRVAAGARVVHLADVQEDPVYLAGVQSLRSIVEVAGIRTLLTIALRKDEEVLGQISIYRQEVRPFTDKQIALLQNFAAQAVIAMENARLLTETREALEQQTATAEVLGVINSSPGDLAPVFDAILEKAHAFCGADYGGLGIYDGEYFRLAAVRG
jgi:GAF domain-containing protein